LIVVHDALSDLGPGVFAGFEEAGVDEALAQGFVFEFNNLFRSGQSIRSHEYGYGTHILSVCAIEQESCILTVHQTDGIPLTSRRGTT